MGFISWWKGEPPPPDKKLKPGLLRNFLDMPFFLKLLTLQTIIFCGVFLAFVFPIEGMTLNGRFVTYDYLWSSGLIWIFICNSIVWPVAGYMMLRRKKCSRMIYLGAVAFMMLGIGMGDSVPLIDIAWMTTLQLLVLGLYLYMRKPAVEYFRKTA